MLSEEPRAVMGTSIPEDVWEKIRSYTERNKVSKGRILRASLGLLKREGYFDRENAGAEIYMLSVEIAPRGRAYRTPTAVMSRAVFEKLEEIRQRIKLTRSRILRAGIALLIKRLDTLTVDDIKALEKELYSLVG
jgi:hypothetical protein